MFLANRFSRHLIEAHLKEVAELCGASIAHVLAA